ncbi:MAG: low molecular weight phosphotyrosine protein phosphatase [Intestinibacter sp.]|uniref:low molecular weight protein-tyrosine-phosphatase n=1 Tax=Intestinibacter sp. TaxID=1965304 RepID=UPI0025BBFEEC|nr:low molecular weight protein-tyrosine-phosphatase [Intestinibacter sp.]MCI6737873.1 low molecular weight phosphotyrosine protein phosphatase [Intestinibacter sp.]
MINIMFVCHGNICRSPMAEFILKDMVAKRKISHNFHIESSATSREEIGNDIHYGTKNKLKKVGVPFTPRKATQITKSDYDKYDFILCMDNNNIRNLSRIIPNDKDNKIKLLLDFSDNPRNIADPWYTGNFEDTYNDIIEGCEALLNYIEKNNIK